MLTSNFFEALMLIAFGCAWPPSIYKSYKTRSSQGKSLLFLFIILFGYICGIVHLLLEPAIAGYVLMLFVINSLMVTIDIGLYYRNKSLLRN